MYRRRYVAIVVLTLLSIILVKSNTFGNYKLKATYTTSQNGGEMTITTKFEDTDGITAMGYRLELPEGWSFQYVAGGHDPDIYPRENKTGIVEFAWINAPRSSASFSYVVKINSDADPDLPIFPQVLYRTDGPENIVDVIETSDETEMSEDDVDTSINEDRNSFEDNNATETASEAISNQQSVFYQQDKTDAIILQDGEADDTYPDFQDRSRIFEMINRNVEESVTENELMNDRQLTARELLDKIISNQSTDDISLEADRNSENQIVDQSQSPTLPEQKMQVDKHGETTVTQRSDDSNLITESEDIDQLDNTSVNQEDNNDRKEKSELKTAANTELKKAINDEKMEIIEREGDKGAGRFRLFGINLCFITTLFDYEHIRCHQP